VTWTELVRHFLEDHPSPLLGEDAAGALQALRERDYWELPGAQRLILLEALIHAAADTEVMRKWGFLSPGLSRKQPPRGCLGENGCPRLCMPATPLHLSGAEEEPRFL